MITTKERDVLVKLKDRYNYSKIKDVFLTFKEYNEFFRGKEDFINFVSKMKEKGLINRVNFFYKNFIYQNSKDIFQNISLKEEDIVLEDIIEPYIRKMEECKIKLKDCSECNLICYRSYIIKNFGSDVVDVDYVADEDSLLDFILLKNNLSTIPGFNGYFTKSNNDLLNTEFNNSTLYVFFDIDINNINDFINNGIICEDGSKLFKVINEEDGKYFINGKEFSFQGDLNSLIVKFFYNNRNIYYTTDKLFLDYSKEDIRKAIEQINKRTLETINLELIEKKEIFPGHKNKGYEYICRM